MSTDSGNIGQNRGRRSGYNALLLALFIGLLWTNSTNGQVISKWVKVEQNQVVLDSLSLAPGSVSILQPLLDSAAFNVDLATSTITFPANPPDSVLVEYRTLAIDLDAEYYYLDSNITTQPLAFTDPFKSGKAYQYDDLSSGLLTKQGNISRAISFGNTQDLSVQSNLNLQLNGQLTDEVTVRAAITDDNLPIQPDGNTQQLQEFDRVYIQLLKDNDDLLAGDFQIKSDQNRYLKFNKKGRGATFNAVLDGAHPIKTGGSVAVSRGRFARNEFVGPELEGNQGPYRLTGENGEVFIIVLSGTERVFIDGKLLTRGQDMDYTIDYNTAEVTFTPNQIITKDKRIVVEFQYSDLNYARSLIHGYVGKDWGNQRLKFQIFSEQDAKNQPLQQDLDQADRDTLAGIGDDLFQAVVPNYDSVGYDQSQVRYWADTLTINGQLDTIFRYSTSPDSGLYSVRFSDVGQGNGDYKQAEKVANGRVFEYVGKGMGRYLPVVLLVSPKARQMAVLSGEKKWKNHLFSSELAISQFDQNTFSTLDSEDDLGWAGNIKWNWDKPLNDSSAWTLHTGVGIENIQQNFEAIERFRAVEFERDWDAPINFTSSEQNGHAQLGVSHDEFGGFQWKTKALKRGRDYRGLINYLNGDWDQGKIHYNNSASWLVANKADTTNVNFLRHRNRLSFDFFGGEIGAYSEVEKKILTNEGAFQTASFSYRDWRVFAQNADTARNHFYGAYGERDDDYFRDSTTLGNATLARNYTAGYRFQPDQGAFGIKATYRDLHIEDSTLTNNKPEQNILGRADYEIRLWDGALTAASFYEVGTGLERQRNFTYLKVPTGQGIYTWQDNNGDGVQQLDEFYAAPQDRPEQKEYIRIVLPDEVFGQVFNNEFSQSLNLKAPKSWKRDKGYKGVLSRFSNQFSYRAKRKLSPDTTGSNTYNYNPFAMDLLTMTSGNHSLRNTVHFNRTNTKFGARYSYLANGNAVLLNNQPDKTEVTSHEVHLRSKIGSLCTAQIAAVDKIKTSSSVQFDSKNYRVATKSLAPKLILQPGKKFRTSLQYEWALKKPKITLSDANQDLPNLNKWALNSEATWNKSSTSRITVKLNFINLDYAGAANTALGYELLQGLQIGKNVTWEANVQHTMANNIQVGVNYNGRVGQSGKAVHTGGVQARAFF